MNMAARLMRPRLPRSFSRHTAARVLDMTPILGELDVRSRDFH